MGGLRAWARRAAYWLLYPQGSIAPILFGPAGGLRYYVTPTTQLAPIYGGPERIIRTTLARIVRVGDVAYDLGANAGLITILLARLVGRAGRVCACEPLPSNVAQWQANVALNGFSHATIIPKAVSCAVGRSRFLLGGHACAGRLADAPPVTPPAALEVETTTLDHLVFEQHLPPPHVIKIDVEGEEANVLAGAERLFQAHRPALIGELHSPEQDVAVGAFLARHRYLAFRLDDKRARAVGVTALGRGWRCPGDRGAVSWSSDATGGAGALAPPGRATRPSGSTPTSTRSERPGAWPGN